MRILFISAVLLFISSCGHSQSKKNTESLDVQNGRDLYLYSEKVDGGIYPDYKIYGYVDSEKKVVIEAKYDMAEPFDGGVAKAAKIKKVPDRWNRGPREQLMWGLINKKDSILIDFEYYELKLVYEGNFSGLGLSDSFLFSPKGDTLKKLYHNFEEEQPFNDSLITVFNSQNRKRGLIDSSYYYLVKPAYNSINQFSENRALVYIRSDKKDSIGYINTKGEEVIPLEYQMGGPFYKGMALVKEDKKEHPILIDLSGNRLHSFDQTFIDSHITKPYDYTSFSGFKSCNENLERTGMIFGVRDCSDSLFTAVEFDNYYEGCPNGGECSNKISFKIFENGYIRMEFFYEGFPKIDIHLPKTNLELSKEWSQEFMHTFGFEYESEKESNEHDLWLTYSHPDFSSDGGITINCDSSYCTIRPYISYNY